MEQDQKLQALEQEVKEVKKTLETLINSVDNLAANVNEMNRGLYDDDKNGHVGVITQYRLLKEEVENLKKEIIDIKKVNADQEVAIKARKGVWNIVLEALKWLSLAALLAQGVISAADIIVK